MNMDSPVIAYQNACKLYFEIQALPNVSERAKRTVELNAIFHSCFQKLMEAVDSEDPEVWYAIGQSCQTGRGVTRDREAGKKWFLRAAEAGHTGAMVSLGAHYDHPQTPPDPAASNHWFREAALNGNSRGMISLGFAYREGRGVNCDLGEALKWFLKAVEAGDKSAVSLVARMYYQYLSSPAEGVRWLLLAEDPGRSCSTELAFLYDDRKSEVYNPLEAVKWYRVTIERRQGGSAWRAMLALARHYRDGIGVPQDLAIAKNWLRRVIQNAPENSLESKDAVKMLRQMQEGLL
jgi:TPR repeat protein